jgi:hypothetical protein
MTTRTRLGCCDSDALKKSKVHSSNYLLLQVRSVTRARDAICLIICKRGFFHSKRIPKTHGAHSTRRTSSVSEKLLYIFVYALVTQWVNRRAACAYLICLFINFLVWRNKTLVGNPHSRHSTQKYRRRRCGDELVGWLFISSRDPDAAPRRASSRSLNGMCVTRA